MLNWWLYLRLRRDWASQAYLRAKIDVEPTIIGAALIAIGLLRI